MDALDVLSTALFTMNCVLKLHGLMVQTRIGTLQHDFTKIMLALTFKCLSRIKSFISCLDISEYDDGPNVNVALAMCWFSRINYYINKFIFLFN